MKGIQRIISFLLALVMVISMVPPMAVSAEETDPTRSVTEAVEETTVPTEAAMVSFEETIVSTDLETEPPEGTAVPTEVVMEPVEETTVPTEVETEPVEETTAPTEAVTEPIVEATAPIESVTVSLGEITHSEAVNTTAANAAITNGTCGEQLNWTMDQAGILTISGMGRMTDFANSDSVPWKNSVLDIKSIVIDDTVTSIGDYAFAGFAYLEDVSLPQNLTKIGRYAFSSAGSSAQERTISITIPATLTDMGDYAFANAKGLTQVVFEDGLTSIGYASFNECTALTEIVIPASVTQITDYAFENCSNVTQITFEGNAPSVGQAIFRNITATAYYPANDTTWTNDVMQDYCGSITWVENDEEDDSESYNVITIDAPLSTESTTITVNGTAPANTTVNIYLNGSKVSTTTANTSGVYSTNISLGTLSKSTSFMVKAECTDSDGTVHSATQGVYFRYVTSQVQEIRFYDDSESNEYIVLKASGEAIDITYTGSENPYKFEIQCAQPEKIGNLYITSTVGNVKKYMDAAYNEETGTFVAVGYFDESDRYYKAGTINVEYTLKTSAPAVGESVDWNELNQYLSDELSNAVVDNTSDGTSSHGTVDFSDTVSGLENVVMSYAIKSFDSEYGTELGTARSYYKTGTNVLSYVVPGLDDSKYYAYLDFSDPNTYKMLIDDGLDVASKAVELELNFTELLSDQYIRLDDAANLLSKAGTAVSVAGDMYNIHQDMESLRKEIANSDNIKDKDAAYAAVDELELDKIAFALAVTAIPLLVSGGAAMPAAATLFTGIVGAISVSSDILYQYRIADIKGESVKTDWYSNIIRSGSCGKTVSWAYDNIKDTIYISGTGAMYDYQLTQLRPWDYFAGSPVEYIKISDGITAVGNCSFRDMDEIVSVRLPNGLQSIGDYAFDLCENLNQIYIPAGVTSIGDCAFSQSGLISINIPNGVTNIGDNAFSHTDISEIKIPSSVTELGGGAVRGCNNLVNVYLPDNLEYIPACLCEGCDSLVNVIIPEGVTEIGAGAFKDCVSLTEIVIPSKVGSIDTYAFQNCSSLRNIDIPDSVTHISSYVFDGCTNLEHVLLGKGVSTILFATFYDCDNLKELIFTGDAPEKIYRIFGADIYTNVYYPADNTSWENMLEDIIDAAEGNVNWMPYTSSEHFYSYKLTKTPTENAVGALTGTCGVCLEITTVTLPKLNATDYTYKVITAATCKATGTARYTWNTTTYGSFYFDVPLPKTEHSYANNVTPPNCTEQGYTTHTCSVCGDSYADTYVKELGHAWDAGEITTAASCTSNGVKTFTCVRCSQSKTDEIKATGHRYESVITAPNCTEQGYTTHTCTCGDSYVDTYVDALDHSWNSGKVTTAATCTKDGVKTFTCTRCSETKTEAIQSPGHSYKAIVTAPNCTEKGYTTHTCSVCNNSYVDTYVDALGHNYQNSTCTRCGEIDPNAATITVTYHANGGYGAPGAQTKNYGVALTLSTIKPTRNGYIFLGWSTSPTATSATYPAGGTYTGNVNVTLYAVWKKIPTYIITLDPRDGSCSIPSITVTEGKAIGTLPVPTRPGYCFEGWYTSNGTLVTPDSTFTSNTTIHASWSFTVENLGDDFYAYLSNKSSGLGVCNVNGNVELGSPNVTASTWRFIRQSNGSYKILSAVDNRAMDVYNNETEDFTNVWVYDDNGSSAQRWYIQAVNGGYLLIAANSIKALDVDNANLTSGTNLQIYTINNSAAQIMSITNTPDPTISSSETNITLKVGESKTFSVTRNGYITGNWSFGYELNNHNISAVWGDWDNEYICPITITGLVAGSTTITLRLWDEDVKEILHTITVNVTVKSVDYTVTFDPDNGDSVTKMTVKPGDDIVAPLVIPYKLGYTFQGWGFSDGAVQLHPGEPYAVASNLSFYAIWKEAIELQSPEGWIYCKGTVTPLFRNADSFYSFTPSYTTSYLLTSTNKTENFPYAVYIKDSQGNDFAGGVNRGIGEPFKVWIDLNAGETYYITFIGMEDKAGEISFSLERGYNVRYDANNGLNAPPSTYSYYLDGLTLSSKIPTRAAYSFLGWSMNKDAISAEYLPNEEVCFKTETTLYAVWGKTNAIIYGDVNYDDLLNTADITVQKNAMEAGIAPEYISEQDFMLRADLDRDGKVTTNDIDILEHLIAGTLTQADVHGAYTGISISSYPKVSYIEGEKLDTAGLELTLLYGPQRKYTINKDLIVTGFDSEKIGKQTLNVTYHQFTTTYEVTVTEAHKHDYTAVITEPTCTEQGFTTYTCGCGDSYVRDYVKPKGHSEIVVSGKAATCTQSGLSDGKKCSTCNAVTVEQQTIPPNGHSEFVVTGKPATCTQAGLSDGKKCAVCSTILVAQTTIPAKGHTKEIITGKPATCTEPGLTNGEKCTVCGTITIMQQAIASTGHNWDSGKVTTSASCTENGLRTYTCGACGETKTEAIQATGHSYQEKVTAPSCTDQGYTTHTCSACGDSYVDTYVDVLGHSWDSGKVTTAATCTQNGVKTFACTRCRETKTEVIQKLDHRYKATVIAPNCTEMGYTTHTCACGDSYVDTYLDALGHSWDSGKVTTAATCTQNGVKTFTCTRCSETKTEVIQKIDHRYKATITAPTCTEQGYTMHTCSVCGDSYADTYVDVLEHDFVNGVCSVCNANDSNILVSGICGNSVKWSLNNSGLLTIWGEGAIYDYGTPGSSKDSPWIAWDTSYLHNRILTVVVEEGITRIGNYSFENCRNITSVTLPESLSTIGYSAFSYCTKLNNIILPTNLAKIDGYAFFHCWALKSIDLPESLTSLYYTAFYGSGLTEIIYPSKLSSVGGCGGCSDLERVIISKGPTIVNSEAFYNCKSLKEIVLPEGIVEIHSSAFSRCTSLESITIPSTIEAIYGSAFSQCENLKKVNIIDLSSWCSLSNLYSSPFSAGKGNLYVNDELITELIIPEGVTSICNSAFASCSSISSIRVPASVTTIGVGAFSGCVNVHEIYFNGDAPVFENDRVFSSNVVATAYYPADNDTWTEEKRNNYGGKITWLPYGAIENRITVNAADLAGQSSVWIDGKEYAVQTNGDTCYIDLPDGNAKTMVSYTYHVGNSSDIHTQYPISMKIWTLKNEDGIYTATRVAELDDIIQYSGTSIRVTGKHGIRMITSIEKSKKNSLVSDGLAGYTLKEYGTVVAWSSRLYDNNPLVLGQSYTVSNYAYKKGIADPVFAYDGDLMQYTNVLVGFSLDQCKDDLAMRPYMILEDAEGNEIILYGGIVQRSIGYIAAQNANTFDPATEANAYNYVWDIIHHVYGEDYEPQAA